MMDIHFEKIKNQEKIIKKISGKLDFLKKSNQILNEDIDLLKKTILNIQLENNDLKQQIYTLSKIKKDEEIKQKNKIKKIKGKFQENNIFFEKIKNDHNGLNKIINKIYTELENKIEKNNDLMDRYNENINYVVGQVNDSNEKLYRKIIYYNHVYQSTYKNIMTKIDEIEKKNNISIMPQMLK